MGSRYGLVSGSLLGFGSLKIAPHFRNFFQTNSWQVHTSAFNGFGRLLMTDPRENVELKPRCLNRYVWGPVFILMVQKSCRPAGPSSQMSCRSYAKVVGLGPTGRREFPTLLGIGPSALGTMMLPVAVERSESPALLVIERSSAELAGPS